MGELIANVLLFATNATIAVTRFFEPFVSAYINYYKDAFATGNLVVIAFAFLLNGFALWAVSDFIKWIFSFRRSRTC